MRRIEAGPVFTRLLSGAIVCLVLTLMPAARGQNVARPPAAGEVLSTVEVPQGAVIVDSESLPPAVAVERRGRLLVLTHGKSGAGSLSSGAGSRDRPLRFAIYQGQRQIASGQFEYG